MQFANEHELLSSLRKGNEKAVQRWYTSSRQALLTFFTSRVSNSADAEELTHDTFLSCLSSLPLFRGESGLWSFMLGIARHELADYWRKKYAKRAIALLPFGQEVLDVIDTEVDSGVRARDEERGASELQEFIGKLPDDIAELLQLKYIDGLSMKELAMRYNLSFAAMQSRIYRAKELFKEQYEQDRRMSELVD